MPSVCMESLLPFVREWAIYENLVAVVDEDVDLKCLFEMCST